MSIELQLINKITGQIFTEDDVAKIDDNSNLIQTTINNLDTNKANISYETPIEPTLINSWINYGTPYSTVGYWKDSLGVVHLKGTITGGVAGTVIFTLPSGYRPLATIGLTSAYGKDSASRIATTNSIEINNNGEIIVVSFYIGTPHLSLDMISFRAGV